MLTYSYDSDYYYCTQPKDGEGTVFTGVYFSGDLFQGIPTPGPRFFPEGEGLPPGLWSQVLSGEGGGTPARSYDRDTSIPTTSGQDRIRVPSSPPPPSRIRHEQDPARTVCLLRFHAERLSCSIIKFTIPCRTFKAPFLSTYLYMFVAPVLVPLLMPVVSLPMLWEQGLWIALLRCLILGSLGTWFNLYMLMTVSGLTLGKAALCLWAYRAVFAVPYIHVNIFQVRFT